MAHVLFLCGITDIRAFNMHFLLPSSQTSLMTKRAHPENLHFHKNNKPRSGRKSVVAGFQYYAPPICPHLFLLRALQVN